jgi:hypothetical protein
MAADNSAGTPRDAEVMEAILKELGVKDYEPNVVSQMLELSYRKGFGFLAVVCHFCALCCISV